MSRISYIKKSRTEGRFEYVQERKKNNLFRGRLYFVKNKEDPTSREL